ncbi:MAG TPA: glycosyltransferase [Lacunisphaera sp.]|nr:glycosyltransferase [Lacunisphaera sp.]
MKILVVTPTLGASPWLAETVASVAALGLDGRHVLVAPAAAVAGLAARFPGVTVLAEPGGGMYAAINAGLAAAGDWAAFTYLNDDDLLLPAFGRVLAAIASGAEMAYGGVKLINGEGRRLGAIPVSHFPAHNRALYALRLEPVYQHGTLVARAAWQRHGGFDPEFRRCGDSEFLARLCVAGVGARHVGGEVAAFRLHTGQLTKDRGPMIAERDRVDAKLGLRQPPASPGADWARCCFRSANLPVYLERIGRHGFISFDELLARGG